MKRMSASHFSFVKFRIWLAPGRKPFLAIADAGSENCHCRCSFSSAGVGQIPQQIDRHGKASAENGTRTTVVRPGGQGNINNAESRAAPRSISIRAPYFPCARRVVYAYRSTVAAFNVRVKCCRSSVRLSRHHAWNVVRGAWWYRAAPLKPTYGFS